MKSFKPYSFIALIIFLSAFSISAISQNQAEVLPVTKSTVHLIGQQGEKGILLRWGPSDFNTWTLANESGMLLQRATVPKTEDGYKKYKYESNFTKVHKPFSKDDKKWETILDNDQYVSAAWVSLYEERTQTTGTLPKLIKTQDDKNQKAFFIGMLAADHSHQAAVAMGLGFVDKTAQIGERYLYKISLISDSTIYDRVVVDYTEKKLPRETALAPRAESKEKAVLLSWSKDFDGGVFTSYQIERSIHPNGPFERLTSSPFLRIKSNQNSAKESYAYYTDSVGVNYKSFYYRIIGINPFGIESNPSPTIRAMGRDLTPPTQVHKIQIEEASEGLKISWDKNIMEPDLEGYIVERSDEPNGPFGPLHEGIISADKKNFLDLNVNKMGQNFYTITVIDTSGNTNRTLPKYAIIADKTPPPTPKGLRGHIDKNGIATLLWDPIDNPKIIGYKVYSSNSPDHVFIMKSGELLVDPTFSEKVALETLSEKIIYKVAAVDKGYGYSFLTDGLELDRPDIVPPSSGKIKGYKIENGAVILDLIPSASADLEEQQLWRKDGQDEWKIISKLDLQKSQFIDREVKANIEYIYALKAIDDAQLSSAFSPFVGVNISLSNKLNPVDNLEVSYNKENNSIDLKWQYANARSYDYLIYRGRDPSNIIAYGKAKSEVHFEDKKVKRGEDYVYGVRVIAANGNESIMVKSSTINLK